MIRSRRPEVFCKKVFRPQACNFIKKEALTQVFYCVFYEISKNLFSNRTPPVVASKQIKKSVQTQHLTSSSLSDKKEQGSSMTKIHVFYLQPLPTSELTITKEVTGFYNIDTGSRGKPFLSFICSYVNRFKTIHFTAELLIIGYVTLRCQAIRLKKMPDYLRYLQNHNPLRK